MSATAEWEERQLDVLVVGAGGAGLRAAVAAAESGAARVAVLSKSLPGKAHTVMAEGGIAAAMGNVDPRDDWRAHYADTLRSGHGLNDPRMVELLAHEAPDRVAELETWGAVFDRTPDGRVLQRAFGGHSHPRLCHVGDRTGKELLRTLQQRADALGIALYPEVTATRLLLGGGRVCAVLACARATGQFVLLRAGSIVLATGGWGRVYGVTSNSWENTGDGLFLALEAGAVAVDLEMVQFHPTGMVWPPGVRGLLVTEGVRGEGGILRNAAGERFMARYDPQRLELSTRDVVARAIDQEVRAGRGTPHGGVWLDITHRGAAFIQQKLPGMRAQFRELAGVDITRQPMEVAPTCHYMMGGLRVDPETGATAVPGLFAAGEVASGVHGANRLGGNSLADLLVFGRRAGLAAAAFAAEAGAPVAPDRAEVAAALQDALTPLARSAGENPFLLHAELQRIMSEHAGILRSGSGLLAGLAKVAALRQRLAAVHAPGGRRFNPGWELARDLQAMSAIAELILRSALERTESRGAHFRTDFPTEDPDWARRHVVSQLAGGEPVVSVDQPTAGPGGGPSG